MQYKRSIHNLVNNLMQKIDFQVRSFNKAYELFQMLAILIIST